MNEKSLGNGQEVTVTRQNECQGGRETRLSRESGTGTYRDPSQNLGNPEIRAENFVQNAARVCIANFRIPILAV